MRTNLNLINAKRAFAVVVAMSVLLGTMVMLFVLAS